MEYFDLVDEKDNVIGKIKETEQVQPNKLRFINIIIIDKDKKIIVPKRSGNRRIFPNCYDFSVGGHVNSGENYEQAAYRELKEELNIENVKLTEIGYFNPYKDNVDTFSKLYLLRYNKKIEEYDKEGITEIYYMTIDEINELIRKEPNKFKSDYEKMIKYIINKNII